MAKQRQASKNHGPRVDALRARPATAFTTLVESWVCATKEKGPLGEYKFFGGKTMQEIELVGTKATALLDTGSEVLIIPIKFFKQALRKGVDLDKFVKRTDGPQARIRNASGNAMDFVGSILLEISLRG
ncbi:unnamed protein product [Nippostrongylus brasiliensis]|uniref:Peptidase A2 domain-containing protein n=1 Tax=Nippostrongylus brasiliensis TaxID=27835 RepID=A0A0N4Y2B6_NIPBR|nr:unnamed protein product [Nippostrongylus brasiliensis]